MVVDPEYDMADMEREPVAYDDFQLVSPLGGLFRYYISDCMYWREALNAQARWANVEYHKRISKTVYELAHRTAVKQEGESDAN